MAMRFYLHGGAYHATEADGPLPEGAIAVPRLPGAGEYWDGAVFVRDHEVAADMAVSAAHIDMAHIIKSIEASLILSGVHLTHGLLVEECASTGVLIDTLAADVASKAAAFRRVEAKRRGQKIGARRKLSR